MCKIKQLNGDAPKYNNYCTSREYEVLCMIAKNEELKVGDLIDGEQLTNKTVGRIWEITECNRVDGGRVSIKDNNGRERTCKFVFGKGTQKPKPQPQTTKQEEIKQEVKQEVKQPVIIAVNVPKAEQPKQTNNNPYNSDYAAMLAAQLSRLMNNYSVPF